jgi:hypothetical protein
MLQSKSTSKILEQAQQRVTLMKTFALDLDLGDGVSLAELEELTETVRVMTAEYNTVAATFEQLGKQLREKELVLADVGDRLSMGLAVKQGKKSREYLLIKGVSRVTRKKKRSGNGTTNHAATNSTNGAESLGVND